MKKRDKMRSLSSCHIVLSDKLFLLPLGMCNIYLLEFNRYYFIFYLQRNFLENLRKSLSSGRSSSAEPALLACVHLCKASTFINREDNSVLFIVSQVLNELKVRVFLIFFSGRGLKSIYFICEIW